MKELLKYIIGIIIIGLILWGIISKIFSGDVLPKQNNVAEIISIDKGPAKVTVDKNGNTHAEKEIIYLNDDQKELYLAKEIDSLKSQLGVKEDQIKSLTTAVSKFKYEIKYTADTTDKANKKYIIDQRDKWFSARGVIPSDTPIIIEGRDSISLAFVEKGRKTYANISSANKAIEYYGIRSFVVPDKPTKSGFGIGVAGQSAFDRKLNYNGATFSGGVKFMSIRSKWMYDISSGYQYQNTAGLYPYIGFGIYKKF